MLGFLLVSSTFAAPQWEAYGLPHESYGLPDDEVVVYEEYGPPPVPHQDYGPPITEQ